MASKNSLNTFKGLLFGALFFFSSISLAVNSDDKQWLRLLHYEKSLTGKYLSEVDGQNFFLAPEGKIRPDKELEAFQKQLLSKVSNPDDHVYCRFPARFRWLKKHEPLTPDPALNCPRLGAFRKRISARSIAIVFSSYYLSNPSSAFGHTFIRLGKTEHSIDKKETATELLDTGINFGAVTGNAGALAYTIGGLTGHFPGTFNAVPYYYKVREYNDYETRDLWSYQLEMGQEEIDFIVDHVWELGHSHFDYYFLTENCSYHVLTILEAARPDINLLQHLPGFYIIPSDTLGALNKEGLIKNVSFRAAPSTLFDYLISKASSEEKSLVKQLLKDPLTPVNLNDERKVLVYDAAISLVDYKYAAEILKEEEQAQSLKQPLLIARSKVPLRSSEPDFSFKLSKAPHTGHESGRILMGVFEQNDKVGVDFNLRFAFHDPLDFERGYPYRSRVEVGHIGLRSFSQELQLRELILVDILTLGKWDIFTHSPSWKVKIGQWQSRRDKRDLSTQGVLGGYGYSYQTKYLAPYLLAHGEISYVSEYYQQFKPGAGLDAGFLIDFNESLKLNSVLEWRVTPWNETRLSHEIRKTSRFYGAGLYFNEYLANDDQELGFKLYFYL